MDSCQSQKQFSRLQKIQNRCVRFFKIPEHIHSNHLKGFHWCTHFVVQRVQFRTLVRTSEYLNNLSTATFPEFSSGDSLLTSPCPPVVPTFYVHRCPSPLWNKILGTTRGIATLSSFKKSFKSVLFQKFGCFTFFSLFFLFLSIFNII